MWPLPRSVQGWACDPSWNMKSQPWEFFYTKRRVFLAGVAKPAGRKPGAAGVPSRSRLGRLWPRLQPIGENRGTKSCPRCLAPAAA